MFVCVLCLCFRVSCIFVFVLPSCLLYLGLVFVCVLYCLWVIVTLSLIWLVFVLPFFALLCFIFVVMLLYGRCLFCPVLLSSSWLGLVFLSTQLTHVHLFLCSDDLYMKVMTVYCAFVSSYRFCAMAWVLLWRCGPGLGLEFWSRFVDRWMNLLWHICVHVFSSRFASGVLHLLLKRTRRPLKKQHQVVAAWGWGAPYWMQPERGQIIKPYELLFYRPWRGNFLMLHCIGLSVSWRLPLPLSALSAWRDYPQQTLLFCYAQFCKRRMKWGSATSRAGKPSAGGLGLHS